MTTTATTNVGRVLEAVASKGETGFHSAALIAHLGMERQQVANCLQQLKKRGLVEMISGGRGRNGAWWRAVAKETPAAEPATVTVEPTEPVAEAV